MCPGVADGGAFVKKFAGACGGASFILDYNLYGLPPWRSFYSCKRNQNTVKGDRFPLDKPLSVACSAGYEFRFFLNEKSKSVLRTDTLPR